MNTGVMEHGALADGGGGVKQQWFIAWELYTFSPQPGIYAHDVLAKMPTSIQETLANEDFYAETELKLYFG